MKTEVKMNPTKVVNLYRHPYDVYIGRAGKGKSGYFGNPIVVGRKCPRCSEVHDLEQTLVCYEEYVRARIEVDKKFSAEIKALYGKTLGCFCKPKACHGDVLAKIAEELQ